MNNDIIFIPVRENTIKLNGSVRNPSIYELMEGEGIMNLLDYSGGLNANSSTLAVINRIKPFADRDSNETYSRYLTSFDISKTLNMPKIEHSVKKGDYLFSIAQKNGVTVKEIKSWNNLKSDFLKIGQKLSIYNRKFELLDGDSITFSSIPEKTLNIVSISGSVNRPGDYPLDQFSSLKDLIFFGANNILPNTYLGKVDISKENLDGSRSFNSYNLYDVLNDSVEVVLDDQDKVLIYSLEQVQGLDSISLISFVNDTLISMPWRENISLYDFVFSNTPFENQDFQKQLLRSRVDINRFDRTSQNFYKISLDLDGDKEFILNKSDEIILYSKNISKNIFPTFKIDGYVNNPGIYRVDSLMTVEDAILKAGGLAEFADVSRVAINSLDLNSQNRSTFAKYVSLDMAYLLGNIKKPNQINYIKDFDRISIVKDPNIKQEFTVSYSRRS